mmetsp:Transcript_56131/g.166940  ORF Transcript_56131/g.166940 Transcript_56131/m.166940 type:complete len:251 (+) Transcript_56131:47-799(+)
MGLPTTKTTSVGPQSSSSTSTSSAQITEEVASSALGPCSLITCASMAPLGSGAHTSEKARRWSNSQPAPAAAVRSTAGTSARCSAWKTALMSARSTMRRVPWQALVTTARKIEAVLRSRWRHALRTPLRITSGSFSLGSSTDASSVTLNSRNVPSSSRTATYGSQTLPPHATAEPNSKGARGASARGAPASMNRICRGVTCTMRRLWRALPAQTVTASVSSGVDLEISWISSVASRTMLLKPPDTNTKPC